MKENRYPPGYVPLTVHKLNNQGSNSRAGSNSRSRSNDNDNRSRRSNSNKGRPRRRRPNYEDKKQEDKSE